MRLEHVAKVCGGIVGARVLYLGAAIALCLVAGGAHAAMYKWADEQGRVQYSDRPPARGDKGAVQLSNHGVILKRIEPGPSAEEKKAREAAQARRKEEELRSAEQRRQDKALLQSFTSVEEIDMKRDRELQAIEAIIANLRGQERSLTERLSDDRRRLESYARRHKSAPDSVREDVQHGEEQTRLIRGQIEQRHEEIAATRAKYEALKQRYRELRAEDEPAERVSTSVATDAQTPAKK